MKFISKKFRITFVAAWLLLSFLAAASIKADRATASAFVVNGIIGEKRSHRVAFPSPPPTTTELFMNDPPETDTKVDEPTTTTSATATTMTTAIDSVPSNSPTTTARKDRIRKAVGGAFWIFFNIQSFMWQSVGIFFTAMMFLNIFGYDFDFDKENGFRIDTIQEFQMERTMENQYATSKLNTIGKADNNINN